MSVKMIPLISRPMISGIETVLRRHDVVATGYDEPAIRTVIAFLPSSQTPIDLARIEDGVSAEGRYDGLCW